MTSPKATPLTCGAPTPCHDCDRDGDTECGLEQEHEGDHVPAADVERMRLEDALDATRAQLAKAEEKAARVPQLEHARGAGYCGYQWGMGARNHGGGCEESFGDCDETYRCLTCGGVFHKKCLERHFAEHSGETIENLRAQLAPATERVAELERECNEWHAQCAIMATHITGERERAERAEAERDAWRERALSAETLLQESIWDIGQRQAERDAAHRETARYREALEALFNGTRDYAARGMGEHLPVDYEMPPSTAKRVRKLIAAALARSEEKADE